MSGFSINSSDKGGSRYNKSAKGPSRPKQKAADRKKLPAKKQKRSKERRAMSRAELSTYANENGIKLPAKQKKTKGLKAVIGYPNLVHAIQNDFVKQINKGNKNSLLGLSAKPIKSALFYGPPGNGKAFIVNKVIKELGGNKFTLSTSTQSDDLTCDKDEAILDLFKKARVKAKKTGKPSIVIVDEADRLLSDRDFLLDDEANAQKALLKEISSNKNKDVYTFLITNNPGDLDPTTIRTGIIDSKYEVDLPNEKDRAEILTHYLSKQPYQTYDKSRRSRQGVNIEEIAKKTEDYTVADLKELVEIATRTAEDFGLEFIDKVSIDVALSKIQRSLSDREIAYYEKSLRLFKREE